MANQKVSQLTAAAALTGAEQAYVVQSAASRRTTTQDIANLAPATDLSYTASTRLLASSTGADVTLPVATTSLAGLLSAADKTKLDGLSTFDPASPGAIGSTVAAAGSFTTLSASSRLNVPSSAAGSPAARDLYAVADTLRYRDSGNVERLLLNAADNLANLSNTATARSNLGLGTAATSASTAFAASGLATASGLTMSTARLLGRSTASTGAVEEIALGTGLSLSSGTLSATGSGTKTLARFTARDNQALAANFATLDTRNSISVLEFDAATEEYAAFISVIPEGANLTSGLLVRIWWMGDTATSGNVRWGAAFEATGTDLDADSFDTTTQVTSAASGTSGIETVAEITCTAIDSLAAGNRFRLRIARIAADATNDTMTGDAQLVAVEVRGVA